jgi:hypothetical protein
MAGDFLFNTIGIEGIFSKDEVCFLSRTPVGEAISDEKDGIIFFPMDLDEVPFASSAEATLFPGVRKRNVYSSPIPETGSVGIKGDLRKMVNFQKLLDIEIEAIADNFNVDILLIAILVENEERGVNAGMLLNKTEDG